MDRDKCNGSSNAGLEAGNSQSPMGRCPISTKRLSIVIGKRRVANVTVKAEALQAYNRTVDKDHTYFISGAKSDNDGVWVHNDCWHALPNDAKRIANIDGYKAYQFRDHSGNLVTVIQKDKNRFETLDHRGNEVILPKQVGWDRARNLAIERLGHDSMPCRRSNLI